MKKAFLAAVMVFVAVAAIFAVPAKPGVRTYTQPDGTTVSVEVFGDEHFHYTTTADGYLLTNVDGRYEYAELKANGTIKSLGIAAQNPEARPMSVSTRLAAVGKFEPSAKMMSERRMKSARMVPAQAQKATTFGDKGLVIIVNFKDKACSHTNAEFEALLNEENYSKNGATGSARDYFKAASNGQYNPHFDVFGPYTLPNIKKYYGGNDAQGNDVRPAQMVVDAMNLLADDKNVTVNFADYDGNNDGVIDNVFIFYAGTGENQPGSSADDVWPHRFVVRKNSVNDYRTYDGKTILDYACTCELKGAETSALCGVGTFCHEFSHVLGLPDLYVTDYGSNHKTSGRWDIMDSGSYNNDEDTPAGYSAGERIFVGWLNPTLLVDAQDVTINELQASNEAFIVTQTGTFNFEPTAPDPAEYFVLENRQQKGWDKYLPGHGMIITKTKYNEYRWTNNTVNNSQYTMGVDIIEADGINGILTAEQGSQGKPGDAFPGSANVTSYVFDKYSSITDIAETDGVITFKYILSGEARPRTVKFDAGDKGTCYVASRTEKEGGAGVRLPNVEPNNGWLFLGWATTPDATTPDAGKKNETYKPTDNITLYAVYVKDNTVKGFTVTFDAGKHGRCYTSELTEASEGAGVKLPDVLPLDNWAFDGWATTADADEPDAGKKNDTYHPTANCTLYAVYHSTSAVASTPVDEVMLLSADGSSSLINLPAGAKIRCVDFTGRTLWSSVAHAESMELPIFNTLTMVIVDFEGSTRAFKNM